MKSSVLELSQKNIASGRRFVRWVVHEIQNDPSQWNKNGISWNEQYVLNNIESAKNLPICVEFIDWQKTEPFGHGMTGVKENEPIFNDSVVVGVASDAYIDNIEVNGKIIRALIAEGYIFEQRYPAFVDWLKTEMYDGNLPETSVEICKKKDSTNEVIIYDGGWKEKGRIPMVYDYSGSAILGIEPSDSNAILLELNNKAKSKKEEKSVDKDIVVIELNNKIEAKTIEINTLSNKITALETQVSGQETTIAELNSTIETKTSEHQSQIETATSELNSTKETVTAKDGEITTLTAEINELKEFKKEADNKSLIAELNESLKDFTVAEKDSVKEKFETFSVNPTKDGIAEIIAEVNSFIAKQIIEQRKKETTKTNEQNSAADVYGDIIETNNKILTEDDLY